MNPWILKIYYTFSFNNYHDENFYLIEVDKQLYIFKVESCHFRIK